MKEKLGVSFHRTFPFSRSAVSRILSVSPQQLIPGDHDSSSILRLVRDGTSLGTISAQAMPRYARAAGLIDERGVLTAFGNLALENDPTLDLIQTQWLIHYHLTSPHHCGPIFWTDAVIRSMCRGRSLSRQSMTDELRDHLESRGLLMVNPNTLRGAATVFLRTYSEQEALGALRVLENTGKNEYMATDPIEVSADVFAYVVSDFWDHHWAGLKTVNLESLLSDSICPASLLFLGIGDANRLLREMQSAGYVEIQRRASPYQIVRLWDDHTSFLGRMYG